MRGIVVVVAALALAGTAAAKECKQVSGTFAAEQVTCPAPFCTAGALTGGLVASYAFAMTSATHMRGTSKRSCFNGISRL